jgi:hypothetical protein
MMAPQFQEGHRDAREVITSTLPPLIGLQVSRIKWLEFLERKDETLLW